MDQSKDINEKQRKFCEEYILNKITIEQAALNAGYSKASAYSQGSRLLKNAKCIKYIVNLRANKSRKLNYGLTEAFSEFEELQVKAVTGNNIKEARACIENKCKLLGLYAADKLDLTNKEQVTEEELTKELKKIGLNYRD